MNIARDFEFILSKFMPRAQLKQALRSAVKDNLKSLRSDIGMLRKSVQQREDSTVALMRLFQFLPHELARIFDEDQTLKIQQEHQSGIHPKRNADIHFSTPLQQEIWNLNLVTFNKKINLDLILRQRTILAALASKPSSVTQVLQLSAP